MCYPCQLWNRAAELVIRSTGAGRFIAPAGRVISVRRSVYYGADCFISDRPVDYRGIRCLLPFDPHRSNAPQITRHLRKRSTCGQEVH
jgi:hypothetical protein